MSHIRGGLNLNADVQPCFFYSNLFQIYVVFAAQFLDIKQRLVINSNVMGINSWQYLSHDNQVKMHTGDGYNISLLQEDDFITLQF